MDFFGSTPFYQMFYGSFYLLHLDCKFKDINLPPDVVVLVSYIRGCFVYCPFLLDLFISNVVFFLDKILEKVTTVYRLCRFKTISIAIMLLAIYNYRNSKIFSNKKHSNNHSAQKKNVTAFLGGGRR